MEIEQSVWGFTPEGEAVVVYTMRSVSGAAVRLCNIGAAVLSVEVPDREGALTDVILGYTRPEDYLSDFASMGKCVGRYAGLIAFGQSAADGTPLNLSRNDPRGHLDGGRKGLGGSVWEGRVETNRVVFSLYSPDGEEGYPGGLSVEAVYDWDDDHNLEITLLAKGEEPTPVNLTQHLWFDLSGGAGVAGHELSLAGETAVPVGATDFGADGITWRHIARDGRDLADAAELYSPQSGIYVSVGTTHAAVFAEQGLRLQGLAAGKAGRIYGRDSGLSLWTGALPATEAPPALLSSEDIYEEHIVFRFGVRL